MMARAHLCGGQWWPDKSECRYCVEEPANLAPPRAGVTAECIAEWRALASAATPGPWTTRRYMRPGTFALGIIHHEASAKDKSVMPVAIIEAMRDEDLAFAAGARTALPEALDAIERVRLECERARGYGALLSSRDLAECVLAALEGKTE